MTDTVAQEYFNIAWPLCLTESRECGVFPEIIFAQSALETGYGLHHPQNNYFGIKGSGANLSTVEVVHGVAHKVMQHFAGFPTMAASFQGYANFILHNRRYKTFRTDGSISAQLVALGTSGYATDPNYAMKIGKIVDLVPEYIAASPYAAQPNSPVALATRITAKSLATTEDIPMQGNSTIPHQTGFLADIGHDLDQDIVDPAKALVASLTAHKSGLQVALKLISGILPYAPLPAPVATTINDVVEGLSNLAASPIPTATPTPSPVADAIGDAETLLGELGTDFLTGNFTRSVIVGQLEAEAPVVVEQLEDAFNPALGIAKNPNAN